PRNLRHACIGTKHSRKDPRPFSSLQSSWADAIVLICDFADNFFNQVFERDDTRSTAILIDHQGHLKWSFTKIGNKRIEIHRFWYAHHVTSNSCCGEVAAFCFWYCDSLLDMQNAANLIGMAFRYWKARKPGRARIGEDRVKVLICFNGFHIHARGHHVCGSTS